MREYSKEMNQRALEAKEQAMREAAQAGTIPPIPPTTSINPVPDISSSLSSNSPARRADPNVSIDDEEGKRSLITNEIQMFRDRFKDEDTKMRNTEKERKDRYERERALQREKRATIPTEDTNKKSSVSPPSRDRSSPNDDRYRSSSSRNNTSNSVRSRTSDRRSSPPPPRYDRRSPVSRPYNRRSRTKSPDGNDEESYERKRQERRLREKEIRYRDVRLLLLYC